MGPAPSISLPTTDATLPNQRLPLADASSFDVPGLSPLITPTDEFFRIDIAALTPSIDPASWRLRLHGLVDRELSLSYDDLLAMPQVTAPVTLACVSNSVGGSLVGTAVWQGVELRHLLELAGVRPTAQQILGRSNDGFSGGFPVECATDGRAALVAIGMNGAPLPRDHGFPARLVVEGLYGYVSSTKWLQSIELTTWDGADGYWIPRGWSKEGPILMSSRVDVPRDDLSIDPGPTVVAGVAWAPDVGVGRVEIRVDGGEWIDCDLGDDLSGGVWRQWRTTWNATSGSHVIEVRCTDRVGREQTEEVRADTSAGETGLHHRRVRVR